MATEVQGVVSTFLEKTNKYNFIFKDYGKDYGMNSGMFLFFDKSIELEKITKDTIENELDFFYLYSMIEPNLKVDIFREQFENSKEIGGSLIQNFCKSCLIYFIDKMNPTTFVNVNDEPKIQELKEKIKNGTQIPTDLDDYIGANGSIYTWFASTINPLKESIKNYGRILSNSGDTNSNYMKSNIEYLNQNIFSEKYTKDYKKPDFSKLKNTNLESVVEKYFTDEPIITNNANKGGIYIGSYTYKNGNFSVGEEITLKPFNSKPSTFKSKFYLKNNNATLNKLTGTIDGNTIKIDASVLTDLTKQQTLDSEGSQIEGIMGQTKGGSVKQNNYSIKQKKNQNKFTKKNNKINKRNGIHFQ